MSTLQLENLNLSELEILLAHVRLGEGHLKKQLNPSQFEHLLRLGTLNLEQKQKVSSNKIEKSGSIALVLNTIITSVFGAWMGFSGFMGLALNSYVMLIGITSLATIISLKIGYFSFKLTANNAQAALNNQKIHNLQLKILQLMRVKQDTLIESSIKHLNYSWEYVKEKSVMGEEPFTQKESTPWYNFETPDEFLKWMDAFSAAVRHKIDVIQDNKIYSFYCERLLTILQKTKDYIDVNYLIQQTKNSIGELTHPTDSSYLPILSLAPILSRGQPIQKKWFVNNYLDIFVGLFPTLLGGFASMFVFLTGGPNLAKELGLFNWESMLRHPTARVIEFSIAISLTLYYGGSFIYNNYKNYIRSQELDKTKRAVHDIEKADLEHHRKLTVLSNLKRKTKRIINIYTAIANIHECLSKQARAKEATQQVRNPQPTES